MSGIIKSAITLMTDNAIEVNSREQLEFVLNYYKVTKFQSENQIARIMDMYKRHESFCILPLNGTHSDVNYLQNDTDRYTILQFDEVFPNAFKRNYEVWY